MSGRHAFDTAIFWLGALALLVEAHTLTGRAPDVMLMRGIGPRSLTAVAVGAVLFAFVVGYGWHRRVRERRLRALLTTGCILGALGALAVMLRHPLSGAYEFPHRHWELYATRGLLGVTFVLLAALWYWQGLKDAIAIERRRGALLFPALMRLFHANFVAPLKQAAPNIALTLLAIGFSLILGEVAVRWMEGGDFFSTDNLVAKKTDLLTTQAANTYDPLLGWVLADNQGAGSAGSFTTGAHGVRMNGSAIVPVPHHAIVATGDSFTAGSEVRNAESWPAQLEALLGEPVVNAATGGWGADQIVLRAESLIPVLEPTAIIVSFLADDILRNENETYGGGNKPYFTVRNGELAAHNIPVPRFAGHRGEIGLLRSLLGHSHLIAYVMQATGRYEWWFGSIYRRISTDAVEVSCLLLKRLKAETDVRHVALYFVLQYGGPHVVLRDDGPPLHAQRVSACARELEMTTIDTWSTLRAIYLRNPDELKTLYVMEQPRGEYGHMSVAGNALVAHLIADAIRAAGDR